MKKFSILLLAIVVMVTLAGCGGGSVEFWELLLQGVALAFAIMVLSVVIAVLLVITGDVVKKSTVTWKGRKIENPVAKSLIIVSGITFAAIYGILVGVVGVLLMLFCGAVLVALSPLWIPAHFILRAYGRKGFFTIEGNTYSLAFNREAFSIVER